jgi:hypothetical protein
MRRLALAGLLAGALVLGLVGPAASARTAPRDTAHFNVVAPWGTPKQRWKLVRGVDAAIANVPKRSKKHPSPTIYIATFMFDRKRTVDRLIAACRRGVSVRVVLDDDVTNRQADRLRSALNADNLRDRNKNGRADKLPARGPCNTKLTKADKKQAKKAAKKAAKAMKAKSKKRQKARKPRPMPLAKRWGQDRSYVKTCKGACRGPGWNMHSKFYVFSSTGPFRHVVKLSSSNLNRGGALKGWNDMYTLRGRTKMYNAFRRIHRQMTVERKGRPRLVEVNAGKYTVRFFPARKAGPRHDPVMRDLRKVGCRTPLGRFNRTKIFVSMFYWKGGRGEYLADRLIKLGRKGCTVQVVMGAPSKKIAAKLRRASRRKVITAYDSRWDLNADGVVDNRTHAKFVLVKGRYNGSKRTYRVMTGSGNWVRGSLVGGDEVSLNIAGKRPYEQYVRAWDRIRNHSRLIGRW